MCGYKVIFGEYVCRKLADVQEIKERGGTRTCRNFLASDTIMVNKRGTGQQWLSYNMPFVVTHVKEPSKSIYWQLALPMPTASFNAEVYMC